MPLPTNACGMSLAPQSAAEIERIRALRGGAEIVLLVFGTSTACRTADRNGDCEKRFVTWPSPRDTSHSPPSTWRASA